MFFYYFCNTVALITFVLKILENKSDYIGAIASFLCLIHCIATPLFFVVTACSVTCCVESPLWWKFIDYFFLFISFNAVYYGTKNKAPYWLKYSLWSSWIILTLTIINESIGYFPIHEKANYLPALLLIGLHIYNQRRTKIG